MEDYEKIHKKIFKLLKRKRTKNKRSHKRKLGIYMILLCIYFIKENYDN